MLIICVVISGIGLSVPLYPQNQLSSTEKDFPSEVTLIKNVNIFDGTSEKLLEGYDVLMVSNLIKRIAKNIPTEGTYELDVKTGGLTKKTVSIGCLHTYEIMVQEGGKMNTKQE